MTFSHPSFALASLSAALASVTPLACGGAKADAPSTASPVNVALADVADAGAGDAAAEASAANAPAGNDFDRYATIPINANDPVQGTTPALVTVVEFGDFQCPFTQRAQATLAELQQMYGPDQLRIIWKNEPLAFHAHARMAAEAAAGVYALAGNDAFWAFHKLAFENQAQLSDDTVRTWAVAAGVRDISAFNAGLLAHTWSKKVDADDALFHSAGGQGTPAFFVNGTKLSGAQPVSAFKTVIDNELAAAKASLAGGTAKEQIYVQRTDSNTKISSTAPLTPTLKEDTKTVNRITIDKAPVLGLATAPVTIVEFASFSCPFSKKVEDTLKQVRTTYGDKVRIVWKDLPLAMFPRSEPAAELAREARAEKGDAGFWDVHDRLFVAQPKLEDADLVALASDAGMNATKVAAVLKKLPYKHTIVLDEEQADSFGASGTPTFFINGRRLVGEQAFAKFKTLIDEELTHAKQLEAIGVTPAHTYDEMMKSGREPSSLEIKTLAAPTHSPVKGTGVVVIQEVADFQSAFVARAEPMLEELLKAYPGKVKLVWRNLPLSMHADAELAAEAAMEAFAQKGDAGFWKMHDALLAAEAANVTSATGSGLGRPALETMAQAAGLDMTKLANALDNKTHAVAIGEDVAAAKDAQITGVPGFVINGYFVNGAASYARFDRAVRAALADAKNHGHSAAPTPTH